MTEEISYFNLVTDKSTNESTGVPGINESGIHLNVSGANKLNNLLAEYILENYNLEDHRFEEEYSYWNAYLDAWNSIKFSELSIQKNFDNYLMLLADKHYNVFIKINDAIELTELEKELFRNIGIDSNNIKGNTYIYEESMGDRMYYFENNSELIECGDIIFNTSVDNLYYQDETYKFGIQDGQESIPSIEIFVTHDEDKTLAEYSCF